MAQSTFIVLVAVLLINTLFYCSAENVYCVTPTATSCSSCPNNIHCATISEYAQEAELYFTSNATMVFLPGDHVLDMNITVANVSRLTMCRKSSSDNIATVVRNGSVGFSFTNMVDFNIYFLAFTSYNRSWSYPASNSALFLQSTRNAELVNCSFHDNIGTALTVNNTKATLRDSEFTHNQCACESLGDRSYCKIGCGITALNSTLSFIGNTTFLNNRRNSSVPEVGAGAILAVASTIHFNGSNNFFYNVNFAKNPSNATLRIRGGGAICIEDNTVLTFAGTNNFIGNLVESGRGGGAITTSNNSSFNFTGTNNFISNSAARHGGAICSVINTLITFTGTTVFSNNSANGVGGAIYVFTNISLSFTQTSNFSINSAMQGGAISAYRSSTLTFNGSISFNDNGNNAEIDNGDNKLGGAMYLATSSTLFLMPNTTVCFENNHATLGAAIYVSDVNALIYCSPIAPYIPQEQCFFQFPGQNLSSGLDTQLVFKNNSADAAGNVLYGGTIDHCKLNGSTNSSAEVFDTLVHIEIEDNNRTESISSDPLYICLCKNDLPDCSNSNVQHCGDTSTVYPGETFQVSLIAVGQRDGTVPSTVRSTVTSTTTEFHSVSLLNHQYLQKTNNTCTKLNYTVFSRSPKVNIELYPEGSPCSKYDGEPLDISVNLNQTCPPGFDFWTLARSCVCEQRLMHYTNHCNITNGVGQITRDSGQEFWVGYDHKLILHSHCPFDYCINDAVVFSLNSTENTDVQCAHNRSGLLCGRCKEGYSRVLGTYRCKKCTNSYLALFIPFAVMGVALVFLLLVCKLTVATGTLSGLVFYANIVGVNRTIFLPVKSTDALSVFIAWLNLDFGIETCFYNGMDTSSKTWLQFVFPVYIWLLVGIMIFISHYSQRFASLLGNNPVSVLTTLILLSYTKVLRTLIAVNSFTHLDYPNSTRRVWLYDANIDCLAGKHIPLFLVAVLVFLFLFLPYTLLLLFGQWLQAISHLRLFSWVNSAKLKPFMDSYHAPYKAKHRYWPGLLLVFRFLLLLVFGLNLQQDQNINLLAILLGAGALQLWAWVSGGVYKNWCLDDLEGSFTLNLIVLAAATYYVKLSAGNQLAVGYTSTFIALTTFVGILLYQIIQQLRHTKLWKKMPILNFKFRKLNSKEAEDNQSNPISNSKEFDQLREPLLDDLPQPTHSVV